MGHAQSRPRGAPTHGRRWPARPPSPPTQPPLPRGGRPTPCAVSLRLSLRHPTPAVAARSARFSADPGATRPDPDGHRLASGPSSPSMTPGPPGRPAHLSPRGGPELAVGRHPESRGPSLPAPPQLSPHRKFWDYGTLSRSLRTLEGRPQEPHPSMGRKLPCSGRSAVGLTSFAYI